MSKVNESAKFRVGYNDYETKDEAIKEAKRRALRDWDDTPVFERVGVAKFSIEKLSPELVSFTDEQ